MERVTFKRVLWHVWTMHKINWTFICHILLLLNICSYATANTSTLNYVVKSFTDETNNGEINHISVSRDTGKVYVGAVNKLYQLSENLTQEKSVITGPKDDAPNCRPNIACKCSWTDPEKCEDFEKKPTNSVSKALVLDYDNDRLIACSNVLQGHCEKRHLNDITQKDEDIWVPMVPYDVKSSVVMFIANGPSPGKVLYIGATRSTIGESSFRDKINAICSRRLDNFKLASEDLLLGSTALQVEQSLRDIYRILYKYAFSSRKFSYFLTVQKESAYQLDPPFITKISRICQNDTKYHSYAEMQLKCSKNNVNYNELQGAFISRPGSQLAQSLGLAHDIQTDLDDVLFAVFSVYGDETAGSALCIYSMREIRRQFTAAIQRCFTGVGNTGPDYMGKASLCTKVEFHIQDNYCGTMDINYPISGSAPIEQTPVVTFKDAKATGITVTTTSKFTVAFVGTKNGSLKKVVIESMSRAIDYETIVISEGHSVSPDLVMDKRKSHVYVVTNREVSKVKVQDCSQYTACNTCLGANDPYCGWCSLESRCTMQSECPKASQPLQWLSYMGEQCTTILRIVPEQVQIRRDPLSTTKLSLTVQNLPIPVSGSYQCAFMGLGMTPRTTTAKVSNNDGRGGNSTLECQTPPYNLLPVIPTGKDHITLNLSVRMDEKDFVSKNFTFFDCAIHSSCTSCTESAYPCTWCVQYHKCTNDRESCGSDTLVTGKNVKGNSDSPGPQSCPRIEAGFTEILVPSSKHKKVTVKAVNLQAFQSNFQCVFSINNIPQNPVNAALKLHDNIECEPVKFEYRSPSPSLHVPFTITWAGNNGQRNALDNPENIQVKVFKCEEMAGNCGGCLTLDNKYECGWCSNSQECRIQEQCPSSQKWLDHSEVCPNPKITNFYPEAGPKQGGTVVTIEGENLGKVFNDIKNGITIAGVSCAAIQDSFVPAVRISCRTGVSGEIKAGKVEILVSNRYNALSLLNFTYVQPEITGFQPRQGPQSGGTRLTITGTHLNAGTTINASLLDKPCKMIKQVANQAVCETPDNIPSEVGDIKMQIDNAVILNKGRDRFVYVSNPEIKDVQPNKLILSGGTNITVTGTDLHVISEPKILVYFQGKQYTSPCEVNNPQGETMICQAPLLPNTEAIDADNPLKLSYGFILDNVQSVRNLTKSGTNEMAGSLYTVYPNPTFNKFKDGVKYFHTSNDILTIEGDNISMAVREEDITIMIGEAKCEVTDVSQKQVTCKPPSPGDEGVGNQPKVKVEIGRNLTCILGTLKFEGPQTPWSLPVIIGASVIGFVLLLAVIIVIVVCKRTAKQNDRVMKQMRNQMDMLEAKVAKECKEAFAELQTDMTEITSDLSSGQSSIPFRDYRSFCMKVLFPNTPEEEHPVVRGLEVECYKRGDLDKGLKQFNVLIGNKTFLLLFIRTLEQNPEFTMRERVNVASLISVALQNRMEYHTDILKTLLAELIEKSMDCRNHPKLLLRRTESVAEKMLTNWFTFLLHKFLLECAGEPLFLLYRAMKQQIEKGPVDALTNEARYSLSEDKLIRQQTDFKPLTIRVRDLDQGYNVPQQEHHVKVLDCDTISQVKDKILDTMYKNQPFSRRPDKDDLDLEWQTGVHGRLILKDEDVTAKTDGEYKKLNTLAHYKVADQAVLALVHKQTSMYNISSLTSSDRSGSQSHFYNTIPGTYGGSPSLSRSMSPNTITIDMDNHSSKAYHLVKPSDSDTQKEGDRGNKMVSEIYLTRLLTTKGTLQQFVDDLFDTIFSTASRDSALPLAIKYMFDFLDDQALHHGITDPEVVHTWKSNSLPLRFWVNVVKNPDFVFDIHKSNIVDSCLTVIGQTFMDSCSMSEHRLGKDSPSSKLLYAKDIPKYKRWVERYYQDIKQMPAISDQDMNATLADESRQHKYDFCVNAALNELYQYAVRYNKELKVSLEEDEFARSYRLASRLEGVHQAMDVTV